MLAIFILALIAILLWVSFSIRIVGPDEMSLMIFLGAAVGDLRDSGPHFVPFFFCSLKRFPKKTFNLDFPAQEVITKEGRYDGESREYGAQKLTVHPALYITLPRTKEGLQSILEAQIPLEVKQLQDWIEGTVVGAFRLALGRKTWREAIENRDIVQREVLQEIVNSNVLTGVGFQENDIKLQITEIKLPRGVEEALTGIDKQRLEAEAAQFEAKQRAKETVGTVIQMMAETRGEDPVDIQKAIRMDPKLQDEFLQMAKDLVQREMAIKGHSFVDIRTQGAGGGIENTLLNLAAAWKRIPAGSGSGSSGGRARRGAKKTPKRIKTFEDADAYFRQLEEEGWSSEEEEEEEEEI